MDAKNDIAVSVFNTLAQPYAEKYMDVSLYLPSIKYLTDCLPENASLLELGAGPGNLTKKLLRLRPDLLITATDLAPAMLKIAKENNPTIKTLSLDCRKINSLNEHYDCVVIGFVLPYLNETEAAQLITDCGKQLTPNGKLYLSTMISDQANSAWKRGSNMDVPKLYMHYYTKGQIEKMLDAGNFEIINSKQYHIPNAEEKDLIVIATKTNKT